MKRWLAPALIGVVCALIAWQVTLSLMPQALMTMAIRRVATIGGMNRMTHAPVVTARSRAIVRPSPDLLYSSCPFDVGVGPVLIDVAAVDAPYWSLSIFDSKTNVAFVRNNVEVQGKPMRVALIRPGRVAPTGYLPVIPDGNRGVALIRILIDRSRPTIDIDQARRQSTCRVAN